MSHPLYKDLGIDVVRDESQDAYIFYVDCDGIPVELMRRKFGDLDAKRAEQQAQRSQQPDQQ